jgi:hypothetical protein
MNDPTRLRVQDEQPSLNALYYTREEPLCHFQQVAVDATLARDTKDKSRIEGYEQQMIIGEKRIQELDQQISSLTALRELSSRCFPEPMK